MAQDSPEVGPRAFKPGERGWFVDMELALKHDTPELVLKTVDEIFAKHGDKLKDDERSFLERARRWAEQGIKLRHERWQGLPSQEKGKG
ncbi:MAG: hypothetical protein HY974_03630 [Candidatus Kerfeldbacteria bacterium]|nr:hypothetical protein [Candidatus Kerfeldbacteria bacterium]